MKILWLDNDQVFIRPHIRRLRAEGHDVDHVLEPTEALNLLKSRTMDYNLLILDVMMGYESEQEKLGLLPGETDSGRQTGLVFYRRHIAGKRDMPPVVVLSIRNDMEIRQAFLDAGLPSTHYQTKDEIADTRAFVDYVTRLTD